MIKPTNPKFIDLTSQKFGRLTVVSFAGQNRHKQSLWYCVCNCSKKIITQSGNLKNGHTYSCGCYNIDQARQRARKLFTTHGLSGSRLYHVWQNMIKRCYNPKSTGYKNYGGRGVKVCKRWRESLMFFLEDMGPRPYGYTLERADNNKGYNPKNCKWATWTEQANNKRNNLGI